MFCSVLIFLLAKTESNGLDCVSKQVGKSWKRILMILTNRSEKALRGNQEQKGKIFCKQILLKI